MACKLIAEQRNTSLVALQWHFCKYLKENLGLRINQLTQKDDYDEILDDTVFMRKVNSNSFITQIMNQHRSLRRRHLTNSEECLSTSYVEQM